MRRHRRLRRLNVMAATGHKGCSRAVGLAMADRKCKMVGITGRRATDRPSFNACQKIFPRRDLSCI